LFGAPFNRSYAMNYADLLAPVHQFLHCRTPQSWIEEARNLRT